MHNNLLVRALSQDRETWVLHPSYHQGTEMQLPYFLGECPNIQAPLPIEANPWESKSARVISPGEQEARSCRTLGSGP